MYTQAHFPRQPPQHAESSSRERPPRPQHSAGTRAAHRHKHTSFTLPQTPLKCLFLYSTVVLTVNTHCTSSTVLMV